MTGLTMKNLRRLITTAAFALSCVICVPVMAQTSVTILDFGALNDCCGLTNSLVYSETVAVGDPTPTLALVDSAGQPNSTSPAFAAGNGATLQWTNIAAWNNDPASLGATPNAGFDYILHRANDTTPTTFTLATANPNDIVTIDFLAGDGRDADISVDGGASFTNIPVYDPAIPVWTNVISGNVGSVSGLFEEGSVQGDADNLEGNIGAARITITSAAAVPEPSSLALLGLGAFGLGLRRRRR